MKESIFKKIIPHNSYQEILSKKQSDWNIKLPTELNDFYLNYDLGITICKEIENKLFITPVLGMKINDTSIYDDGFYYIEYFHVIDNINYNDGRNEMICFGSDRSNSDGLVISLEKNTYGQIFSFVSGPWPEKEKDGEIVCKITNSLSELIDNLSLYIYEDDSWKEIDFDGENIIYKNI